MGSAGAPKVALARAVLFDLDGVLVDSYEAWFQLVNAAARALGYPAVSRPAFDATWGQGVGADIESFFPRSTLGEITAFYTEHFLEFAKYVEVNPEASIVLERLGTRRVPFSVVTNTPSVLAQRILKAAKLKIDVLVGGDDVPNAKPAPDMLLEACSRLGVEPGAALMVGDSHFDRDAARVARIRFAGLGIDGDLRLPTLGQVVELAGAYP